MNHFDSSDANHQDFRSGSVVLGYDRGDGLSAIAEQTGKDETAREGLVFDPAKSYGQTRATFETEFEQRYVSWLLSRHSGNISAAAREARMDRKHLHDLAKKHGLRGRGAIGLR